MEKLQVLVLRSLQFSWKDNRNTQIATIYRRLELALDEKQLSKQQKAWHKHFMRASMVPRAI